MKPLALAALFAALLALALWLWIPGADAPPPGPGAPAVQAEAPDAPRGPASLDAPGTLDARSTGKGPLSFAPAPDRRIEVTGPVAPRPHWVTGLVVLLGEDGLPVEIPEGILAVELHDERLELPIQASRYAGPIPSELLRRGGLAVVLGIDLPGPLACDLAPPDQDLDLALDQPGEVQARVTPGLTLEVVDARTGRSFEQVLLLASHDDIFEQRLAAVPEPPESLSWLTRPPVDLTDLPEEFDGNWYCLLVTAPGAAWQRVYVDRTQSGVVTARLEPGADVPVEVLEVPQEAELVLQRLQGAEAGKALTVELYERASDPHHLGGLLPGRYRAEVLDGPSRGVLASAEVTLVPGPNPPLVLTCGAPPERAGAPVSFLVTRPVGYGPGALAGTLTLGAVADPSPRQLQLAVQQLAEQTWLLEADQVPPGRHALTLSRPTCRATVVVPEQGLDRYPIELPMLLPVTVEVRQAESGQQAALADLFWVVHPAEGAVADGGRLSGRAEDPTRSGRFKLLLPRGEVSLTVSGERALVEDSFEIVSGGQHLVLEVMQLHFFDLALVVGDQPVPAGDFGLYYARVRVEGPGEVQHFELNPGSFGVAVDQPGRYTVSFAESADYAAVGPVDVMVGTEARPRIEFALTPRDR